MNEDSDITREAWYAARVQEIINTISNSVARQQERADSNPRSED